jgi:hypothetical protein
VQWSNPVSPWSAMKKANMRYGSGDIGNTPSPTKTISDITWITSITTRSNTGGQSKRPIGRIHHSTITCAKAYCRPIGQAANTKENSANKQHPNETYQAQRSPDVAQRNPGAPIRAQQFSIIQWGEKRIPDCISLHPGYACFFRGCCKFSVCNITRLQLLRACCCESASQSAGRGYSARHAHLNYISNCR